MSKPSTKAEFDFLGYLYTCTPAQLRGVWEKEKRANRLIYVQLVLDEAARRCFDTTDWVVTTERDPLA